MGWKRPKKIKEFDDKTYPDLMLDLETMGVTPKSAILSIGAVRFRVGTQDDVASIQVPFRCFYARLDDMEQRKRGRTTDDDTMTWWNNQDDDARSIFDEHEEDVSTVLKNFNRFCRGVKRIWGNGATFDNTILRSLYKDYDQEYPVPYWKDLDMRTVSYLWNFITNWGSNGKTPQYNVGIKHNALDDARRQCLSLQHMIIESKGSKYEP